MIKAVIFDIDGTLIDTVDLHAKSWVQAFKQFGFSPDYDEVRARIGEGADHLIPAFVPKKTPESLKKEIEQYRAGLFKREYLPHVRAFPGVRALFEKIRLNGQKTVLGSSCTAEEIETYKEIANIADLVDGQATSDDAGCSKPSPDIFEAALRSVSLTPAEVVVVGDTVYDAKAAVKAGIAAVGVLCGGTSESSLREAGCVAVYENPEDLLRQYEHSPLCPNASQGRKPASTLYKSFLDVERPDDQPVG